MLRGLGVAGRAVGVRRAADVGLAVRAAAGQLPQRRRCSAAASAAGNALLGDGPWWQLPEFSKIDAEQVEDAVSVSLGRFDEQVKGLLDDVETGRVDPAASSAAAAETLDRLERMYDPLSRIWGTVSHLNRVVHSPQWRVAVADAQPGVVEATTRFSQDTYPVLARIDGAAQEGLDEPRKRALHIQLREAELAGAGLADSEQAELTGVMTDLAGLGTKFANNLVDSVTPEAFHLDITDAKDVEGMPDAVLRSAAHAASTGGHEGASPSEGPWRFTLDQSSLLNFLKHNRNRDLREHMYRNYVQMASQEGRDNQPVIKDILAKRRQVAALLGYRNYAEVSVASKCAESVDEVVGLLERMRDKCHGSALRELDDLGAFASTTTHCEQQKVPLEQWDVAFWGERQREATFGLTDDVLCPYFPLPKVLTAMFHTASNLFGVNIAAADGEADVWHPDVRYFKVVSQRTGQEIAAFFLDPYARPGTKGGGAWMDVCVGRSGAVAPGAHEFRLPVAHLVCNQAPPVPNASGEMGDPVMRFSEVQTLWHEFGHGLQHMLTDVNVGPVAGISGVEWDAVELPSQFMEHWCYHPATLRSMTSHVQTGEPLPDSLINNLRASRIHNAAIAKLRQLNLGRLDMELHRAPAERDFDIASSSLPDPLSVQRDIASRYALIQPLEEDRFLCSFQHIFAGGYAAGYYSYKYAEVMAADAFEAFIEKDLDNAEAMRNVGHKFRNTVLGQGGAKHPLDVFTEFRGRKPSEDALLRLYGLQ